MVDIYLRSGEASPADIRLRDTTSAAVFIGRGLVEADSGTLAWPSGTAAGDNALLLLFGNGTPAHTGSGWTQDVNGELINEFGSVWSAWHKVSLSSGEVATPFTFSGTDFGGYIVIVYRGGAGINYEGSNSAVVGTTNTLTGFTKAATSDRVVAAVIDRSDTAITIGAPTGFTDRTQGATTFFKADAADIASSGYVNSATVVWTGLEGSGTGIKSSAGLWEITAGAAANKILAAAAGSYDLTGTAATPKIARLVVAGAGSYALTGTAASPLHGWKLSAAAGSYALTGTAASLLDKRRLTAGAGSYVLTGTAASLLVKRKLTAGAGSYALTGAVASPLHQWRLVAAAGSYVLTGTSASLLDKRKLAAGSGAYLLTGSSASLIAGSNKVLPADAGAYVLTGVDASLILASSSKTLSAGAGAYLLTGATAALLYAALPSATPLNETRTPLPPTTVRSWLRQVEEADPDIHNDKKRPPSYKFSNGREFR